MGKRKNTHPNKYTKDTPRIWVLFEEINLSHSGQVLLSSGRLFVRARRARTRSLPKEAGFAGNEKDFSELYGFTCVLLVLFNSDALSVTARIQRGPRPGPKGGPFQPPGGARSGPKGPRVCGVDASTVWCRLDASASILFFRPGVRRPSFFGRKETPGNRFVMV